MGIDPQKTSSFDPSTRAEGVLDLVLDETSEITQEEKANEVDVESELKREQIIKEESQRVRSRVLFLTNSREALEKDSLLQKHFADLEDVFDEVHVIVLGVKKMQKTETIRLARKVWVYPTVSRYFITQPWTALSAAKQQLLFTDGFRPDVVVALDPFESGVAGYLIAQKYKRSFQVHITVDFFTKIWQENDPYGKWRLRFARFVLKRTTSVRVQTDTLKNKLTATFKHIQDIAILPRYFNIQKTMEHVQNVPKQKLYPQFSFVVLFVGELTQDSTLFRAIDAARNILRTPTIGMVIIGQGAARASFQERTRLLGIDKQIIFTSHVENLVSHMQAADVLICTDTTSESEEVVITAAASGLPLIIAKTPLREDLFVDEQDAYLCDPTDTIEFSQRLGKILNANVFRTQFASNAKDAVATRIEEKPEMYRLAYRDTIEEVLYLSEEELEKKKQEVIDKEKEVAQKQEQEKEEEEKKQLESLKKANKGLDMHLPEV